MADVELVKAVALRHMADWPLHNPSMELTAGRSITDNKIVWLAYRGHDDRERAGTHFDVNIIDGVFFLLSIQLDEQFRGVGNGEQLYNTLTEIAREIGCREIRQSPSGRTATKQSRVAYLRKRGWVSDGCEAFKSLIACGP